MADKFWPFWLTFGNESCDIIYQGKIIEEFLEAVKDV